MVSHGNILHVRFKTQLPNLPLTESLSVFQEVILPHVIYQRIKGQLLLCMLPLRMHAKNIANRVGWSIGNSSVACEDLSEPISWMLELHHFFP